MATAGGAEAAARQLAVLLQNGRSGRFDVPEPNAGR